VSTVHARGKRRSEGRPEHEELVAAHSAPATVTTGRNVADHVLGLQRDYGNTAVTTAIQRKGGKGGKGSKAKPKEVSYFPDYDPTLTGTPGEMRQAGLGMIGSDEEGRIRRGIHFYEQAYLRTDGKEYRSDGNVIYNGYKKVGDGDRASWWLKVAQGIINPFAAEDQTGKGH
jgi:hypothetical protein